MGLCNGTVREKNLCSIRVSKLRVSIKGKGIVLEDLSVKTIA